MNDEEEPAKSKRPGGGIGQFFGWSALFWLMFAIALALLPAVLRVLPDEKPSGADRFDVPGGILLGLGSGPTLFGITQAQVAGFGAPSSWASLAVAASALALFGWRTVHIEHPFVPPSLFANRVYRASVVVAFLAMAVNLGALVFVPLLLVDVNDLRPGEGALVMVPAGVAIAALSPLIGRLADRLGARPLVLAGLAAVGAFALFLSAFAGSASVIPAGIGLFGLSIGFMFVMTPIISAAAGALSADQVGVGLGILQGTQFLGAGAGPAVFGALVTAAQLSGREAANPLHAGQDGAAYSDAFLVMAAVAVLALFVAYRNPALAQGEAR